MKFVSPAIALAAAAVIAAACAAPAATTPTATAVSPTAAPSPSPTSVATAAVQRIEVSLSDQMRIEPAAMTVRAGEPVTFVVTNTGAINHEFYLGDEEMQDHHEDEMAESGGMMGHDEEGGIAVEPGETKELMYTFEPGTWLAGCHIPGHYPAGMKATILITD